jgi:hypothetical protein
MVEFQVELRESALARGRALRDRTAGGLADDHARAVPGLQAGVLDPGTGVHDDGQPRRAGPPGRRLVDDAQLKPHRRDVSRSFSATAWSTTAPTLDELTKQSTTWMEVPSGTSASVAYPVEPRTVSARGWIGTTRIPSSTLRNWATEYAARARFVDEAHHAHVAVSAAGHG